MLNRRGVRINNALLNKWPVLIFSTYALTMCMNVYHLIFRITEKQRRCRVNEVQKVQLERSL